jgi:rRNA maturation RNase YbeY
MNQGCRKNPRRLWGDLSLVLTDDAGITRINRLYLDQEYATDVISFAGPSGPGSGGRYSGELFVNVQRAREVGRADSARELALYIAHACDHACGATDRTRQGCRRMRARELGWLRAAAKMNLLKGLLVVW